MANNKVKKPFSFRRRRSAKEDKENFWSKYFVDPAKKAWESLVVKIITGALLLISYPMYYNYFENPYVDFPVRVEVLDAITRRGIEGAEIYVQDTPELYYTNERGTGTFTLRVRTKEKYVPLTCTAEDHETQEKKIPVPAVKGAKPEFYTLFVLTPKDL